jgi:hypothetical protein
VGGIIGLLAGLHPALRASTLEPADAAPLTGARAPGPAGLAVAVRWRGGLALTSVAVGCSGSGSSPRTTGRVPARLSAAARSGG